jgi:hypothetical protein
MRWPLQPGRGRLGIGRKRFKPWLRCSGFEVSRRESEVLMFFALLSLPCRLRPFRRLLFISNCFVSNLGVLGLKYPLAR